MVRILWTLVIATLSGCSCQPNLTVDDDMTDPTNEDKDPTALTADTAPPPPCVSPEVEPNNSLDVATPLVVEQRGCGVFGDADFEFFAFELDDDGWVTMSARADNGSIADVVLSVLEAGDLVTAKDDDTESADATITFQAAAGSWALLVQEADGRGGDRYGYEVLVTEAKPPVEWTSTEAEPNDSLETAEELLSGDVRFGFMDGEGTLEDTDWFRMAIPGGKHDLHIDVDAWDFGSTANTRIRVRDDVGEVLTSINGGAVPSVQRDPDGIYESPGDEVVYLQVQNQGELEGIASWYVLRVELEAL